MRGKTVAVAFAVFLVLAASGAPSPLRAAADAADFVQSLADQTIAILADEHLSMREREQALGRVFDRGFDVPTISRFVLGRYWRTATPAQRQEYQAVFREFIVKTNSRRFSSFSGERLQITGVRGEGEADTMVATRISGSKEPPIRVMWRVRRFSEDYKVIDVVVEGVSMIITQRDEFASVIRKGGGTLEGLIDTLEEKIRTLE